MKPPLVQKFGGSSLATIEKVRAVAEKVVRAHDAGHPLVVVVSAMGDTTSQLVGNARAITPTPPRRELDVLLSSGERMSMALLSMAIHEAGRPAVSLTGAQSGIRTDAVHTNASIVDVDPERILRELARERIVIVAGYQGATESGEVTTLGRGGSDTTAVALAGALGASRCEIYSDVSGVYTADPRDVAEPVPLRRVGAGLMTEYARHGARVLHPPCLEHARATGVTIRALATFGEEDGGTSIGPDHPIEYAHAHAADAPAVVGVASRGELIRVHGRDVDADRAVSVLDELAHLDTFREVPSSATGVLDVLVDPREAADPVALAADLGLRLQGRAEVSSGLASVSVVAEARATRGLRERAERALRAAGIPVTATYVHPVSITSVLPPDQRRRAVQVLHDELVASELQALQRG